MKALRALAAGLLRRMHLEQLGVFIGWTRRSGWWRSVRAGRPLDASGNPLPWYSYPFLHFLDGRLASGLPPLRIFEFGSGNSTRWWARHARELVAVEDNAQWHGEVTTQGLPDHVQCVLAPGEAEYVASVSRYGPFDVIVVDGSHRPACLAASIAALGDQGVIILDNSDWPWLADAIAQVRAAGFRQIEFHGLGPANGHPWGTSVFYRPGNVFGI